jgi:uncharacterized protein (DUF111 family)
VKVKEFEGRTSYSPEYEECARIAREKGVPLASVIDAVLESCKERTTVEQ